MQEIAAAIQEGAHAYLSRQYRSIFVVGLLVAVFFWWGFSSIITVGFLVGAILSGLCGYAGMAISVRANVRTAEAARGGLAVALKVAFRSGAVTGFLVAGVGLLSVTGYTIALMAMGLPWGKIMEGLVALGFGGSLISLFARLGGGIFTKGADVGADLVGKIEAGIPEDDPRNPAVIADNVGDNVGDCAGTGADLFETYVVTLVASLQMAFFQYKGDGKLSTMLLYPFALNAVCMLGCLIGTSFVKLKGSVMGALYRGLIASVVLSAVGIVIMTYYWVGGAVGGFGIEQEWVKLALCACVGLVTTGGLVWITEYYTASRYAPVQSIAKASVTGAGTNLIQGLAVSLESCFLPALLIAGAITSAYLCGGLFGISLAATTMLSLTGIILSIDAYGPVTDNAGGIAEMAGLPASVRHVTDQLDAVGNTTKAVTKGYAIGSAALAALVLFSAYTQEVRQYFPNLQFSFDLENPMIIIGLLVGGSIPYLFSAMSMKAVGRAGASIVIEVRRQFSEIKGIMEGTAKPDYEKAVDILTQASLRAMILPSLLPLLLPIGIWGFVQGAATISTYFAAYRIQSTLTILGGALLGLIVTGFFLAVSMTSGGGAWDNAKKYIEEGHHGGKGSPAYHAAVTGDTVGDPYKDTAGPAINPLIKIANLAALLFLTFL
jgi:K(+)-stimulated pyrophosphate-energized sodium pump